MGQIKEISLSVISGGGLLVRSQKGGFCHSALVSKTQKIPKQFRYDVNSFPPPCLLSSKSRAAFTLAEVLITLGIIGIVAAMTMPSLIQNHKKTVVISRYTAEYGLTPHEDCSQDCIKIKDPDTAYEVFNKYYAPYLSGVEVEKGQYGVFGYLPDDTAVYLRKEGAEGEGFSSTYMISCITHKACKNIDESNIYKIINGKDVFLFYTSGKAPIYIYLNQKNTRAQLVQKCKAGGEIEACTALIVGDGWQIAKDYPIRL